MLTPVPCPQLEEPQQKKTIRFIVIVKPEDIAESQPSKSRAQQVEDLMQALRWALPDNAR